MPVNPEITDSRAAMQATEPTVETILQIPDFAVVVLIGISGSGKSTFAARHFLPSEILSSDAFRAMVSDDENDQAATTDAFDALHYLAAVRLRRRKLVVIDATDRMRNRVNLVHD
jgi:predicted kinase